VKILLTASAAFPPSFSMSVPAALHIELSLETAPRVASPASSPHVDNGEGSPSSGRYMYRPAMATNIMTRALKRLVRRRGGCHGNHRNAPHGRACGRAVLAVEQHHDVPAQRRLAVPELWRMYGVVRPVAVSSLVWGGWLADDGVLVEG